jgi:alkanesulfonate monooxygenase
MVGKDRFLSYISGSKLDLSASELFFAHSECPEQKGSVDSRRDADPSDQNMRFLVAIRPGLMTPTATARMVATFDQLSIGRLLINVVVGGDPVELAGDGLHLKHDQRYELTGEFLQIFRRVLAGESVDFTGKYFQVNEARLFRLGVQKPYPELWFGGSSPAGQQVAAKHVDVYLTLFDELRGVFE